METPSQAFEFGRGTQKGKSVSKNSWFKHYNKAHEGQTMAELWAAKETEVIAFYWTLLELVSKWESEESRGELQLKFSTIRSKLGMNSQRTAKLLTKISETFEIKVEFISKESFKVSIPNWLELQETRGGKREAKLEQKESKKPTEARGKKKDLDLDTDNIPVTASALPPLADKTLGSLIWKAYEVAYLTRYQVTPLRNAKTNSQCSQLAKRLGQDAVEVVKFYLTHNDGLYLKRQHDLGSLLYAAEGIHTQWQRGQAVTSSQVRQFEKQSTNMDLLERVKRGEV